MIGIDGRKANPDVVSFFSGQNSLVTAKKVFDLAASLDIKCVEASNGAYWIAFEKDGRRLSNVAFYEVQHAYAFLLGFGAAHLITTKAQVEPQLRPSVP
jgi:hypothetical protein